MTSAMRPAPICPRSPAAFRLAALALVAGLATAGAAQAQNSLTSQVQATTQVDTPASISVTQDLNFSILPQALSTGLTITSSTANGLNANVVLGGVAGAAVSVSVPAQINVTRNGGGETVTIRTVGTVSNLADTAGPVAVTGIAAGGLLNTPVTVVGTLDGGVLSFSIGGAVTVANTLVPGDYHGVLTVVAQYN